MQHTPHNSNSLHPRLADASSWAEIAQRRTDLGFSQANIARVLAVDQSQVSRYERQGKEVSSEERSALLSMETLLAEKPLDGTIKRLEKMQRVIGVMQEASGGILGALMEVTLPTRMK